MSDLRMPSASCVLLAVCFAASAACEGAQGGTESGNPNVVDRFEGSQCYADTREGQSVAALTDSSKYAGLTCVAWEARDDGRLRIDVLNMNGPCLVEIDWQPRVEYAEGALEAIVSAEPECRIAACGGCSYDFTFELKDIAPSAPLSFRLWPEICRKTEESPEIALTLPLDQAVQGIRCRPLLSGFFVGITGTAHGSCRHDADAGCDPDLVCQETDGICLTQCTSDDDCPLSDVEVCEMNRCVVPASF